MSSEMNSTSECCRGTSGLPHLEERGDWKVTIREEFMYAPVTARQGWAQSCCRSKPVAHMK